MTLAHKALSKLSIQAVSLSIQAIFQIITLTVYARYIKPEAFGVFAIAGLVQNFAEMFSSTGISSALVQRKKITGGHISSALYSVSLLSIFFYLLIYSFSGSISEFYQSKELESVLKMASLSLIILSISSVPRSILQRSLRFKEMMISDIIPYFIGYILLGIYLAMNGFGVWTLVYAILLTSTLKMFFLFYFARIKISFKRLVVSAKELVSYSGGITLLNLTNSLAQYMDKIIIGRLLTMELLGLYERISHIVLLMSKYLGNTFDSVLFPLLSGIQDEKKRVQSAFLKASEALNVLILPLTVFMIFYSRDILLLVLGEAWLPANMAFKILLLLPVIRLITRLSDSLVRSLGAVYKSAFRKTGFLLTIVISLFLGARYGLTGTAFGVLVAVIVHYLLMLTLSLSLIDISFVRFIRIYVHGIVLGAIATILSLISFGVIQMMESWDHKYNLFVLFLDIVLYLIIIYNFPRLLGENVIKILYTLLLKVPLKGSAYNKLKKRLELTEI